MAHRQLARRYAAQLNAAHKRTLELESTIADLENDLAMRENPSEPSLRSKPRSTLASAAPELKDAQSTYAEASALAPAGAEAKRIEAERLLAETKQSLNAIVDNMQRAAEQREATYQRSTSNLEKRLQAAHNAHAAQKQMGCFPAMAPKDPQLVQQLQNITQQRDHALAELASARGQLQTAVYESGSLRIQVATLKREGEGEKRKLAEVQVSCQKLDAELSREKKRRIDAKFMSGAEGEKCRGCTREVIDLVGDD
ncbi:hypothetical protein LTR78_008456 [Recurvomyces mirabilis]|uniref:Uncharacterized protein n=1 Tax=Recurvomyces mirabilis TaxID=574656 RepID=A0AAE0TUT4_9PEZI|nr:hypothetical protein LTR78_008456 [Recurvomyces mirabilis]KAK5155444.1 hypothetical protein LTS14_005705 [Recurvomyces mirabilis]